MKKVLDRGWMIIFAFVMVSAVSITTTKAQGSVSLQVFYDELQPYGTWMDHGQHGYVWIPRVEPGFTPYATSGHWIYTEYGNTWVSDYEWGWAPFHYGRWAYDDFYGWIWVPDTEWAPAWVAWRNGGGYYGWAPLMPGISMHMAFHYYNRIPHHYWSFVPHRYITYRHVYRHCVPRPRVVNIINNTTIVTHNYTDNRRRTYFTGPSRNEIERTNRQRVEVYKISDGNRPGRTQVARGSAKFYKPEIDNSRESRSRSMPSTFVRKDRAGNLEQVENRRQRNSDLPAIRKTEEVPGNIRREQMETENRTLERQRYGTKRDVQADQLNRTQRPIERENQRSVERENQNVNPVDRGVPVQREPAVREQREFNQREHIAPVERPNRNIRREQTPATREFQRSPATVQPQQRQQTERQNTNRQMENVQRERSGSHNSSPKQQFRKSDSDNSSQQPARSTGRTEFRKRN